MLLIEFEDCLNNDLNLVKYRNVNDDNWYYIYMNVETLNLLIMNFGIISTKRYSMENICIDNPTTSKNIKIKYCNASIEFECGNKTPFNRAILEQKY